MVTFGGFKLYNDITAFCACLLTSWLLTSFDQSSSLASAVPAELFSADGSAVSAICVMNMSVATFTREFGVCVGSVRYLITAGRSCSPGKHSL